MDNFRGSHKGSVSNESASSELAARSSKAEKSVARSTEVAMAAMMKVRMRMRQGNKIHASHDKLTASRSTLSAGQG